MALQVNYQPRVSRFLQYRLKVCATGYLIARIVATSTQADM